MALRPVRIYGDPVLRTKAKDVTEFDDTLRRLVEDMFETMAAYQGVGLAANQVGVLQRVFVVDVPVGENERVRRAIVNPVLDGADGSDTAEEGCLSMPGIYEDVKRRERVRVQALDLDGDEVEMDADGWVARILQHEIDHLDGVLFIDRIGPMRRALLKKRLRELQE